VPINNCGMRSQCSFDSSDGDVKSRSLNPPSLRSTSSNSLSLTGGRRRVSASVPIDRQYALNNQVLTLFDETYKKEQWLICYEIGRNFVETALFEMPKHGYYYSPRHEIERLQTSFDALRVADLLGMISQRISEQDEQTIVSNCPESFPGGASVRQSLENEAEELNKIARMQAEEETLTNYMKLRDEILAGADQGLQEPVKTSTSLRDIMGDLENLCLCGFFSADDISQRG